MKRKHSLKKGEADVVSLLEETWHNDVCPQLTVLWSCVERSRAEESFVLFAFYPAKGKPGHPMNTGNDLNYFKTIRERRKQPV